ncbi:unnamed protein product [Darwinula stevensoni]|uniref:Uncharacterized protein n=1 Tax=Darwinula stevensoni TaxID=69355 RepID=A0A7R8XDW3_9CRUS|nr:unnamed protein product [Darwinula stevensoni]CAG0887211.1 unnamed protein product [Darwinula stevensoni]
MDNQEDNGKTSDQIIHELLETFGVKEEPLQKSDSKEGSSSKRKSRKEKKKKKKKRRHESSSGKSRKKRKSSDTSDDTDSDDEDWVERTFLSGSDSTKFNLGGIQKTQINGEEQEKPVMKSKTPASGEKLGIYYSESSHDSNEDFSGIPQLVPQDTNSKLSPSQEIGEQQQSSLHSKDKKIQIKNLKFSAVYQQTLKEVEEREAQRRAKYEEGELESSAEEEQQDNVVEGVEENTDGEVKNEEDAIPNRKEKREKKHIGKKQKQKKDGTHQGKCNKYKTSSWSQRCSSKDKTSKKDKRREKHCRQEGDKKSWDERDHTREHKKQDNLCKEQDIRHERSIEKNHKSHGCDHRDASKRDKNRMKERSRSRERGQRKQISTSPRRHSRSPEHRHRSTSPWRRRRRRSRSNSHSRGWRSRSPRRRQRSKSPEYRTEIDKEKLLQIARKNALKMLQPHNVDQLKGMDVEKLRAITAGGKSLEELTEFCKKLVVMEGLGCSSEEDNNNSRDAASDDDDNKPFIHHPFLVKERQSLSVVINVKLPVKTPQERISEQAKLRLQFPVSSGSQHRKKEPTLEWEDVIPEEKDGKKANKEEEKVFEDIEPPTKVISDIVSQRLNAIRRLQENPHDVEALNMMYKAQEEMSSWAKSKELPGQFTGHTGARVLSQQELNQGFQAWARKDQLVSAAPSDCVAGRRLLEKMGWKPGEGLGKNKEGTLEPLSMEVKMDKRGLVAMDELHRPVPSHAPLALVNLGDLSGKHPVSALMELCSKRKWGPPSWTTMEERGPPHQKVFRFKVLVNGQEYMPEKPSPNKKTAKADAATLTIAASQTWHWHSQPKMELVVPPLQENAAFEFQPMWCACSLNDNMHLPSVKQELAYLRKQ